MSGSGLPQQIQTPVSNSLSNLGCLSQTIIVVIQSLNRVQLFVTLWTTAHQASLSFTTSQSLLKLMSIESVMPSSHLILCHPLLLPSVFPSIRVFCNESALCMRWTKYWSFSISQFKLAISPPPKVCSNSCPLSR